MLQHRQTLQSWLRSHLVTNGSVHIQYGFWIQSVLQEQMFWSPELLLSVLHRSRRRLSLVSLQMKQGWKMMWFESPLPTPSSC